MRRVFEKAAGFKPGGAAGLKLDQLAGFKFGGEGLRHAGFLLLLVLSGSAALVFQSDFSKAIDSSSPWINPVVTRQEVSALSWVRDNTAPRARFMSCIFEGEMLMGHALREGVEGGDWAVAPDVVQQMQDASDFFSTPDGRRAWELGKKHAAEYAWVPQRDQFCGFSWSRPSPAAFSDNRFFQKVFSNEKLEVYKLAQEPPRFESTNIVSQPRS